MRTPRLVRSLVGLFALLGVLAALLLGRPCAPGSCRFSRPADRQAPLRTLSLVAGHPGGSGNIDGIGSDARFQGPAGLAFDGASSLFVADAGNHTIRKIDLATLAVTTLAGARAVEGRTDGIGAQASFGWPHYDGTGYLYVADAGIRRIAVATGAVTTLASAPVATGLAYDGAGTLYWSDNFRSTIAKIVLATNEVTTIAGSPVETGDTDGVGTAARFGGPKGLAYAAGKLYVADGRNHAIRRIDLATGAVSTLAGAPPRQGTVDGVGADALFTVPEELTYDGHGHLYVFDSPNSLSGRPTVRRIDLANPRRNVPPDGETDAMLLGDSSQGITFGEAGTLFLAGTRASVVLAVDVSTGDGTIVAGSPAHGGSADGVGAAARFNDPGSLAFDGAGNAYVADRNSSTIRKIDVASQTVSTLAGSPISQGDTDGVGPAARFKGLHGLAYDGSGTLYVADGNSTIRKVTLSTGAVATLAGGSSVDRGWNDGSRDVARFADPSGLAYDGVGGLYVADESNATVRKVDVATGRVTTIAGSHWIPSGGRVGRDGVGDVAEFVSPAALVHDGDNSLYVTDRKECTIRMVALPGRFSPLTVTTLAGSAGHCEHVDGVGSAARFSVPSELAYDGVGNLYVAEWSGNTIRKVSVTTGAVTTVAGVAGRRGVVPGLLPAGLSEPAGLAFSPSGSLFLSDSGEDVILQLR
jgi:hypothetical protein